MTQITPNNNIPMNNGYTQTVPTTIVAPSQPNVATSQGVTVPIYQYPTTSLYGQTPNPQQGVNIIINSPSGMGQPSPNPMPMGYYPYYCPHCHSVNNNPTIINYPPGSNPPQEPASVLPKDETIATTPIATTPVNDTKTEDKKSKKELVAITDQYVKTVESYLRSPDKEVRQMGITELIKRFEEDSSRYDHPALNALLNIALQDPSVHNRIMAMSPIATESAHGNLETSQLLEQIIAKAKANERDANGKPSAIHVEEAKMAQEALLKTVLEKTTVEK